MVELVGLEHGDDIVPVLLDTRVQFSLDLEVIASAEQPLVYAVEQPARPEYRVFSLDPSTGHIETVLTVPEDAIPGADTTTLRVAVLETDSDITITLGELAIAHGNHDVPATCWGIVTDGTATTATPTDLDPVIIYDAASTGESMIYATHRGLSMAVGGEPTASRAIRFVAG